VVGLGDRIWQNVRLSTDLPRTLSPRRVSPSRITTPRCSPPGGV